ncbi:hypothetical protein SELMODRAFT_403140 [Selaginella moellendorffii]|uniref:C2 domain-containing protein n=1 Tax=Selaginella moellendorffii TaxID=88036 RepID=D8QP65_SELML|nr:protein QUIRKY [Selaginella moellendorffii]XP_024532990.1 protein QUIRKY [Selaginella moellendorffii]EFJ38226.1 hypothetical protein SELMODRAFT_403140 [Selaginella moellendorffii]|eukprot:XP_002960687.1 protein QUIRKY [Selaginella moellendorffii]
MGKKVVVEILSAHNLMPKDGHGSANAYCIVEFDGQRQATKVKTKDLNPVWNEKLEFQVRDAQSMAQEAVRIEVLTAHPKEKNNRKKDGFLGRVRIEGISIKKQGDEAIVSYLLQKRSPFSHIKGELRVKVYWVDEAKKEEAKKGEEKKDGDKKDGEKKEGEKKNGEKKDEKKVERPPPPTVVPAADYVLKERAPVVTEKVRTYDLVEKMLYLYVRVVKGRNISKEEPYVVIKFGEAVVAKKKATKKDKVAVWEEVFAFSKDKIQGPTVEIVVAEDEKGSKDLGSVVLEISDIPFRVPDSPLAPQWHSLEDRKTRVKKDEGEVMLAVWSGTQEDESFPIAWQSDTGGHAHTKAKVYLSPKLWYLMVNVIEAQDLAVSDKSRFPNVCARVTLGPYQKWTTTFPKTPSASPMWNESKMFVAAEPFEEHLVVFVEDKVSADKAEVLGSVKISLAGNKQIARRSDPKEPVASFWYNLDKNGDKGFKGRVHLRLSFEGGYHVMDESTSYISDMRPTAKHLWKKSLGILQVGILQAKALLPMKNKDGRGTTDAYCVAKYGPKWIRTRTVVDSLNPKWNEQYTWEVYDPCTVVTICVFDNCHLSDNSSNAQPDGLIGKIRIRLSTLESNKVYANSYPLIALQPSGVKKMGELEITVRLATTTLIHVLQAYFQPPLPKLHYTRPLPVAEQEMLRIEAIRIVAGRLGRAEPPLRQEVIRYMLDTESNMFSMRRSRANYARLTNVLSGLVVVSNWFHEICKWSSPVTTLLVHVLFLILAWFPELILPTLFLYLFLIGVAHYRHRPRAPPSMDAQLSHATDGLSPDELDEEFDTIFTKKHPDLVKARYERLRLAASRLQTVVGDIAAQGERVHALLSWRDPRATGIFITFCFMLAIVLYVVPFKVIAILVGLYAMRHPRFRDKSPSVPMNFFRRLPSLADRIL